MGCTVSGCSATRTSGCCRTCSVSNRPLEGSLAGLDGVLIGLRTRDLLPALLAAQCRSRPVVLLIEDIQWIDGASEELLANLVAGPAVAGLLIINTRRPEYLPRWLANAAITTQSLAPLAADDIIRVAKARLGVDQLPDALVQQVTERGGGNPLFSEEILGFLVEQGVLRVEAGKAVFDADAGETALPTSLLGLLAARLDRLPLADRALLQVAAVIGRRFDPGLVAAVATGTDDVDGGLRRLEAQNIIALDSDGHLYIFTHALLRDCVYHGLLPERRSRLHLVVASALEHRSAGRLAEVAETLAHHFAQTGRKDLAFTYLTMAGVKSLGVFSHADAERYLRCRFAALHGRSRLRERGEQFADLLASYALCLNMSLSVKAMIRLAGEVIPILDRIGDSRDYMPCFCIIICAA